MAILSLHPGNRGSKPLGDTIFSSDDEFEKINNSKSYITGWMHFPESPLLTDTFLTKKKGQSLADYPF